jgi:hypothetical protein
VSTDGHIGNDWFRTRVWATALARANLGFRVTPHGLRHAHASWLLAGGADLQVVKERLGHGSITTTQTYLHTLPGADTVALAALDAVRGHRDVLLDRARHPDPAAGRRRDRRTKRRAGPDAEDAHRDEDPARTRNRQRLTGSITPGLGSEAAAWCGRPPL